MHECDSVMNIHGLSMLTHWFGDEPRRLSVRDKTVKSGDRQSTSVGSAYGDEVCRAEDVAGLCAQQSYMVLQDVAEADEKLQQAKEER